jgi:hypothetical protein
MSGKVVLCIVVSAGISALRCGAAVYQSDGSAASVQGLHNAVLNGDTITIPAGTFTWNTQVRITKNITLSGAGQGATVIVDNVPKTSGDTSIPMLFTGITGNLRITGFTVHGMAQDTNNANKGTIVVRGTTHSMRIDHVTFDQPGTGAIHLNGPWGVVDHCYFNEPTGRNGVHVGGSGFGDESWEAPTNLGSGEGVYIEDCTFIGSGGGSGSAVNAHEGGRVVFRHNTLHDQNTGGHGTEGDRYRGMRSYEIYQNTFTAENLIMDKCIQLRGGTGVVWGNVARGAAGTSGTGYKNFVVGLNFRSFTNYNTHFGSCIGSNPWDQNSADYACLDQVGRGQVLDQVRGNPPINQRTGNAAWPRNQLEPVYVWSNSWTPVPNNPGSYISQNQSPCIVIGRDIINNGNTPKSGYTPFVYPHPLVTTAPAPAPTPPPSATQCSLLQQRLDRLQRRQERLQRRHRQNPRLNRRIRRVQQQLQRQNCF